MERKYKKVVVIGVDGAGTFFKQAETPFMDKIFADGAQTFEGLTAFPSISGECWGAMLHGVDPEVHKLTNTVVSGTAYDVKSAYPSFFRVIRENYPDAKIGSFCNWNPINFGIIENNLDVTEGTGDDDNLTNNIINYINNTDFDLIFVQFDSVDGAGHRYGYGTEGHLNQINHIDSLMERIYGALENRGFAEDTLFVVTADHGGTPGGNHGGDSEAEMKIYIGVRGKGVKKGVIADGEIVSVKSISAIVLYAFGLEMPETWSAVLPDGIFA